MTTVAWDLAGLDDHGGDPAEHVGGEGPEGLHEVGILSPGTEKIMGKNVPDLSFYFAE